ncbi:N-acetylmuramoyl-L-alanine amidase [uncultured Aquimarina sp.]|uniref:N-acetylmuramoyl-L-alanine amidase n=1 Tax=uncultured Aquimarina sp. TaxID=575652 RepID=UPI002607E8BF|nr:N-acetylmuramoyl-L-alanine amidase [uncultured Aquimarina sp.]
MKKVDYLIILSTDTGEGIPVTKEDIIDLHTTDKKQGGFGFNRPGIDALMQPDGSLDMLVSEDNPSMVDLWGFSEGKNGILGVYRIIAYVGGRTEKEVKVKDTRTKEQIQSLEDYVRFHTLRFPKIQVLGFDEAPAMKGKENPAFNVCNWLEEIGVPEQNIFKKIK